MECQKNVMFQPDDFLSFYYSSASDTMALFIDETGYFQQMAKLHHRQVTLSRNIAMAKPMGF